MFVGWSCQTVPVPELTQSFSLQASPPPRSSDQIKSRKTSAEHDPFDADDESARGKMDVDADASDAFEARALVADPFVETVDDSDDPDLQSAIAESLEDQLRAVSA